MAKRLRFRTPESYRRRAPSREPYDSVAIVCEGSKTEPSYFHGLRTYHRLSSTNILIVPGIGDPLSIAQRAIRELESDKELDRAYCVFDKDSHTTYNAAMQLISGHQLRKAGRLFIANSVPCFELWLLLHFNYSAAPYMAAGGRSAGAYALADLQTLWPEYAKAMQNAFQILLPRLDVALKNATRLAAHNAATGSLNPATRVNELVRYLIDLNRTEKPA